MTRVSRQAPRYHGDRHSQRLVNAGNMNFSLLNNTEVIPTVAILSPSFYLPSGTLTALLGNEETVVWVLLLLSFPYFLPSSVAPNLKHHKPLISEVTWVVPCFIQPEVCMGQCARGGEDAAHN